MLILIRMLWYIEMKEKKKTHFNSHILPDIKTEKKQIEYGELLNKKSLSMLVI